MYTSVTEGWLRGLGRRALKDRSGSIALIAGLTLTLLVGAVGLALDLAQTYAAKAMAQRIADQSALAAAFAYANSGNSLTVAQDAAASLAKTNGLGASLVNTSIVTSPSGDGNKAALVTVTTPVSLTPFGVVGTSTKSAPSGLLSITVTSIAYAEVQDGVAPCVIALGSSGVAASGGGSVTATDCSVESDGSVTGVGATQLTAQGVYAVGSISPIGSGCQGTGACVKTAPTAGQTFSGYSAPTDPLASAGVFSRIPTVAALTAPSYPSLTAPASGGGSMTCASGSSTLTVASGVHGTISTAYTTPGCSTITFTGGATTTQIGGSGLQLTGGYNETLNFASGTYLINGIATSGAAATYTFNVTSTPVTFEIWNGISVTGVTSIVFNGTATYDITGSNPGGIFLGSTGSMTFANGSTGTSTFTVAGGINIQEGSATFPNGTYTITSGNSSTYAPCVGFGISIGSETVKFGTGSYKIGNGICVGGSGSLTFGGPASGSSVFQIPTVNSQTTYPGIAIQTNGGSSLTMGNFPNTDINGGFTVGGNLTLGSGVYTVNGAFNALGSGGVSITGSDIQLIASGAVSFGQGYTTVNLSAPTAITTSTQSSAGIVAVASDSSSAATFTGATSGTIITGVLYTPDAALTVSGVGNISDNGGCVEVIVKSLTFAGSGTFSSDCPSLGGSSGVTVALVQ